MANEDQLLAGAGLERWFADWVESAAGALSGMAEGRLLPDNGVQNVRAHLANLHPYVEQGTAGLDTAIAAIVAAAEALANRIGDGYAAATYRPPVPV